MSDMLTQEEINALLSGGGNSFADESPASYDSVNENEIMLTTDQQDILGEIGNISMGTSATTLSTLLGQKVWITTPKVKVVNWDTLSQGYDRPCVGIRVDYKEGLEGSNILILKERDVKIIADLMMGGDGSVQEPIELNELDLSAIGEAMNQMVGSSSTSLSTMISRKIDIDTPKAFILNFNENTFFETIGFAPEDVIACISFKMEIGDLIDSEIMQVIPIEFSLDLVNKMMNDMMSGSPPAPQQPAAPAPAQAPLPQTAAPPPVSATPVSAAPPPAQMGYPPQMTVPPYPPESYGYPPPYMYPPQMYPYPPQEPRTPAASPPVQNVNVKPAEFQPFNMNELVQQKENIDIIMDVPLEVTVELGRTKKKIREILELVPGTVVDLDKLVGEPIDILVNGKFVATGEVVVMDENFAVRVADIISVDKRI